MSDDERKLVDTFMQAQAVAPAGVLFSESVLAGLKAVLAQRDDVARSEWIGVDARLPEKADFVLAFVDDGKNRTRRIRAFYARKFQIESGNDDSDWAEYDEAADEYYLPQGWYEANEYEETNWHVNDPVTHWQPLPDAPPSNSPREQK